MKKNYVYSFSLLVLLLGLTFNASSQYCTSFDYGYFFDCDEGDGVEVLNITGASSTSINYASTACNAAAYWNLTNTSITFEQGGSYSGNAMSGYYDNIMSIWIDFNNNNTFESSEKLVSEVAIDDISSTSFSIVIPGTAQTGTHRMRVMAGFNSSTPPVVLDPCNYSPVFNGPILWSGRVQDFTVNIIPNTPTPVKMSRLTASNKNGASLLDWHTFMELNNKGFEVQQSGNATDFTTIAFVNSKAKEGNSNYIISYSADVNIYKNTFFRIAQVDFDGNKTFSNVVSLSPEFNQSSDIHIIPNPATNTFVLNSDLQITDEGILVEIYSLTGKIVHKEKYFGQNSIDVSSLSTGSYIVKVRNGATVKTAKLIKK